jgi:hypothetical protein
MVEPPPLTIANEPPPAPVLAQPPSAQTISSAAAIAARDMTWLARSRFADASLIDPAISLKCVKV